MFPVRTLCPETVLVRLPLSSWCAQQWFKKTENCLYVVNSFCEELMEIRVDITEFCKPYWEAIDSADPIRSFGNQLLILKCALRFISCAIWTKRWFIAPCPTCQGSYTERLCQPLAWRQGCCDSVAKAKLLTDSGGANLRHAFGEKIQRKRVNVTAMSSFSLCQGNILNVQISDFWNSHTLFIAAEQLSFELLSWREEGKKRKKGFYFHHVLQWRT